MTHLLKHEVEAFMPNPGYKNPVYADPKFSEQIACGGGDLHLIELAPLVVKPELQPTWEALKVVLGSGYLNTISTMNNAELLHVPEYL